MYALGTDFTVNLPVVGAQTVSIPIDEMAQQAVAAAWPSIQQKIESDMQPRIDAAVSKVTRTYVIVGALTISGSFLAAWWMTKR